MKVDTSYKIEDNRLKRADSTHSIMRSAMRFLSGTIFSRLSGLIRDIVLAFSFGTSEALSALFVAFRLSYICRRLFGEGSLQSAFIPIFEEIRKESTEKAFLFFRDMTGLWTLFLSLFTCCIMLILAGMNAFFSFSEETSQIMLLMAILTPSLIPICLFGLNASFLQCEKKYFTVGIAPTCFNLILAMSAFYFSSEEPHKAMPYIAFAMCFGCFLQWLVTFIPAYKVLSRVLSRSQIFSHFSFFSQEIQRLWKPLLLGLLGIGASQINNAIDTIFARIGSPEGPAQLWFGLRLQQLPLALFGLALSGALLPPLSRAIQDKDRKQYKQFLSFAIRRVFAFLLPCTVFLLILGMDSINALYGRGDFQIGSIIGTTKCLHGYALALLPMGFIAILAPAFYAQQQYIIPTKGACLSLSINFILNCFFIFYLEWGPISIAIATSISAWANAAYLYYKIEQSFGDIISPKMRTECYKTLMTVIITGAIIWSYISYSSHIPLFFTFFEPRALSQDFFSQMSSLLIPTALFIGLLFLFAKICNASDLLFIHNIDDEKHSLLSEQKDEDTYSHQ